MKQNDFEKKHSEFWQTIESALRADKKNKGQTDLPETYLQLCHHLSLAKQRRYSTNLVSHLNNLVIESHQKFYGPLPRFSSNILFYFLHGFPEAIRKNKGFVFTALALFFLPGLLFFVLCLSSNDLIYSLMSFDQVKEFEQMYGPSNETFGKNRNSDSDLYMFSYYIMNNIGISFQTFASGIIFGIGSVFFLVYNGIYIGAAAGHVSQVGYTDTFFPFVVGHGAFELTAIAFAGAAGLKLGWALIAPGQYTRISALKLASKDAVVIIYGTTVMLLIAAFLEAFWSSSSTLSKPIKYSVGGLFWFLVTYYFVFFGRNNAVR